MTSSFFPFAFYLCFSRFGEQGGRQNGWLELCLRRAFAGLRVRRAWPPQPFFTLFLISLPALEGIVLLAQMWSTSRSAVTFYPELLSSKGNITY